MRAGGKRRFDPETLGVGGGRRELQGVGTATALLCRPLLLHPVRLVFVEVSVVLGIVCSASRVSCGVWGVRGELKS